MTKKKTHEEFLQDLERVNPKVHVLGKYVTALTKIPVQCKECKYQWDVKPNGLLSGNGCPQCAGNLKKTHSQFVYELNHKNDKIAVLGKYLRDHSRILVECKQCGYQWNPTASSLLQGSGCPKCAGSLKKTHAEFQNELEKANPDIKILGTYNGMSRKVLVICTHCNYQWEASPHHLLRGRGCPNCCHSSTSYVEQLFLLVMQKVCASPVLSRDRKAIGMELDIYLPKEKVAIEYGAWKWHCDKIENDKKKMRLCEEVGIHLIEIFDSCKKIPEAYSGYPNVWMYKEDFGDEANLDKLICLLRKTCDILGFEFSIPSDEFEIMRREAYKKSRIRSTEEFAKALCQVNSDIVVIGEYRGNKNKISVRCKVCGNIWAPPPSSLLSGHGCPKCGKKRTGEQLRKSPESFESEINEINPDVKLLERYVKSSEGIKVECRKCGYQWVTSPSSLLVGHGCPKCAGSLKKTTKEFVEELKLVNPDISVLDEYKLSSIKVSCECRKCVYRWNATPNMLLRGTGCPQCAGNVKKTQEQFEKEIAQLNPDVIILGQYIAANRKLTVECRICHHHWSASPNSLLRGSGCPRCAGTMKRTHDEFLQQLESTNSEVAVLSQYVNANTKILVRCKKCDYGWETTPSRLLSGYGCPQCAGNIRKTNEQFAKELAGINPDIIALENYNGKGKKILVKCKICEHQWRVTPNRLLSSRSGCPNCSNRLQGIQQRKSQQQFLEEMSRVNPRIRVIGEYEGAAKNVLVECSECKHRWSARAGNLLHGSGCPNCYSIRRKHKHG